jgi:hypothetical protein
MPPKRPLQPHDGKQMTINFTNGQLSCTKRIGKPEEGKKEKAPPKKLAKPAPKQVSARYVEIQIKIGTIRLDLFLFFSPALAAEFNSDAWYWHLPFQFPTFLN